MFHAKKSLGQNFLKFPEIAEKIVKAGNVTKDDVVVEVGPGFGILTEKLLKKAKKVIAIELDRRFEPMLQNVAMSLSNIEFIFGDALEFDPPKGPYKLIANLPYSITSPLLNHFIKDQFLSPSPRPPKLCVVMVQKEVAKKICAKPPDMNVLALNIQAFGKPRYLFTVGRGAFQPQPKVDSAVIEIEIFEKPLVAGKNLPKYFSLISAAFSQKRKTLGNSLKKIFGEKTKEILEQVGIDSKRRPETLAIEEWKSISEIIDEANARLERGPPLLEQQHSRGLL